MATLTEESSALVYAKEHDKELYWALSDALIAKYAPKHRCGDCNNWMKSRECPKEKKVKGLSRGPSSGDCPCDKFVVKPGR